MFLFLKAQRYGDPLGSNPKCHGLGQSEVANHVALDEKIKEKRSKERCYSVGSRRGIVAGRQRIRFN